MEDRSPEILVSFSISGRDFDPDECTSFIGYKPTGIWRQKPHLKHRVDLPNICWIVESTWMESDSLDNSVGTFVSVLQPYGQQIKEYTDKYTLLAAVEASIRIWNRRPLYTLSLSTIGKLTSLSAEFGLDIYDCRD